MEINTKTKFHRAKQNSHFKFDFFLNLNQSSKLQTESAELNDREEIERINTIIKMLAFLILFFYILLLFFHSFLFKIEILQLP